MKGDDAVEEHFVEKGFATLGSALEFSLEHHEKSIRSLGASSRPAKPRQKNQRLNRSLHMGEKKNLLRPTSFFPNTVKTQ